MPASGATARIWGARIWGHPSFAPPDYLECQNLGLHEIPAKDGWPRVCPVFLCFLAGWLATRAHFNCRQVIRAGAADSRRAAQRCWPLADSGPVSFLGSPTVVLAALARRITGCFVAFAYSRWYLVSRCVDYSHCDTICGQPKMGGPVFVPRVCAPCLWPRVCVVFVRVFVRVCVFAAVFAVGR